MVILIVASLHVKVTCGKLEKRQYLPDYHSTDKGLKGTITNF